MRDVFCSDQFENLHIRSADTGNVVIGPCCNTIGIAIAHSSLIIMQTLSYKTSGRAHTRTKDQKPA